VNADGGFGQGGVHINMNIDMAEVAAQLRHQLEAITGGPLREGLCSVMRRSPLAALLRWLPGERGAAAQQYLQVGGVQLSSVSVCCGGRCLGRGGRRRSRTCSWAV
jgi:hypothetical protein